jgi:hypothetical protein
MDWEDLKREWFSEEEIEKMRVESEIRVERYRKLAEEQRQKDLKHMEEILKGGVEGHKYKKGLSDAEVAHLASVLDRHATSYLKEHTRRQKDTFMFSVRFADLVTETPYDDIVEVLEVLHSHHENLDPRDAYATAYKKISECPEKEINPPMLIEITYKPEDADEDEDVEPDFNFNVSGVEATKPSSYAIEFNPWQDWANFRCNLDNVNEIGKARFVAYALWELTFVSYEEEVVEEAAEGLSAMVEDAKAEYSKDETGFEKYWKSLVDDIEKKRW